MAIRVTKKEYERLKLEIKRAQERYKKAERDKAEAHSLAGDPDMHENPAAEEAYSRMLMWAAEIGRISKRVNECEIVDTSSHAETAEMGVEVTLLVDGEKFTLLIAGPEGRLKEGEIANTSPIGRAILGKKPGFETKIKTPAGTAKVKILSIGSSS